MAYGNISFPGIINPIRAIATRTTGTRPDTAIIFCQPQDTTPDCSGTATLVFGFGGIGAIWTNCLCDRGTIQYSTTGQVQAIEIKDLRWAWSKAYFTAAFNVRMSNGSIDPGTIASLAQIAYYLFSALGVIADVSEIRSLELPELIFDHDRCDDALDELLTQRGYVISLHTDNTVKVYVRGTGATLPANDDVVSVAITIDPPEVPYVLTVCGNHTLVQSMMSCLPVGLDVDGSVRDVNLLSYKPSAGWGGIDFGVFSSISDPVAKQCALRSVGLWYQVNSQADGSQSINYGLTNYSPGEVSIASGAQYLPLEPNLLESNIDVYGKTKFDPPYVTGTFFGDSTQSMPAIAKNTDPFTRVDQRDWKLDRERGIVMFRDLAYKMNPGPVAGNKTFADVFLTCTYSVRNPYIQDRFIRQRVLGGLGEDLRKIDELERHIIVSYLPNSSTIAGIDDNLAIMNAEADSYLDAAENNYTVSAGNLLLYRGIYPFNTDGVALQIRWDVAVAGCVSPFGTHVAQNFEGIPQLPSDFERSHIRRIRMQANPTNRRRHNFKAGTIRLR